MTAPLFCHPCEGRDPGPYFAFQKRKQTWIPSSDGMTAGENLDSSFRWNDRGGSVALPPFCHTCGGRCPGPRFAFCFLHFRKRKQNLDSVLRRNDREELSSSRRRGSRLRPRESGGPGLYSVSCILHFRRGNKPGFRFSTE